MQKIEVSPSTLYINIGMADKQNGLLCACEFQQADLPTRFERSRLPDMKLMKHLSKQTFKMEPSSVVKRDHDACWDRYTCE